MPDTKRHRVDYGIKSGNEQHQIERLNFVERRTATANVGLNNPTDKVASGLLHPLTYQWRSHVGYLVKHVLALDGIIASDSCGDPFAKFSKAFFWQSRHPHENQDRQRL